MPTRLPRDMEANPPIFSWNGPLDDAELSEWVDLNGPFPDDLVQFWLRYGGGDFFENETILGPFGDPATADDVTSVTVWHRSRGLPRDEVVMYTGIFGLGTVSIKDLAYRLRDWSSLEVVETRRTLGELYESIRAVLGWTYGLPDAQKPPTEEFGMRSWSDMQKDPSEGDHE